MSPHDLRLQVLFTQPTVDAWAELTGDYNPLHVDSAYAARTRFGGTIVHGHLLLANMLELAQRWAGDDWPACGRLRDVRFLAPVLVAAEYEIIGVMEERRLATRIQELRTGRVCVSGLAERHEGGRHTSDSAAIAHEQHALTVATGTPHMHVLHAGDMHPGRTFGPYWLECNAQLIDRYLAIIGAGGPIYSHRGTIASGLEECVVPAGLAPVLARKGYMSEFVMPPGAIMLGQDVQFMRAIPVGSPISLSATVSDRHEGGRGVTVLIDTTVRLYGDAASSNTIRIRWPAP